MPLNESDRNWIRAELASHAASTKEAIYESETRLLTAFHKWASPTEQKLRTHREALRALDLQIEQIAGRVPKLEADADNETRH